MARRNSSETASTRLAVASRGAGRVGSSDGPSVGAKPPAKDGFGLRAIAPPGIANVARSVRSARRAALRCKRLSAIAAIAAIRATAETIARRANTAVVRTSPVSETRNSSDHDGRVGSEWAAIGKTSAIARASSAPPSMAYEYAPPGPRRTSGRAASAETSADGGVLAVAGASWRREFCRMVRLSSREERGPDQVSAAAGARNGTSGVATVAVRATDAGRSSPGVRRRLAPGRTAGPIPRTPCGRGEVIGFCSVRPSTFVREMLPEQNPHARGISGPRTRRSSDPVDGAATTCVCKGFRPVAHSERFR